MRARWFNCHRIKMVFLGNKLRCTRSLQEGEAKPTRSSVTPQFSAHSRSNDWLMVSWKSALMILIATIILSLPILSKAQTTTLPSCVLKCLEEAATTQGCQIDDTQCICAVAVSSTATAQNTYSKCLLDDCRDADIPASLS